MTEIDKNKGQFSTESGSGLVKNIYIDRKVKYYKLNDSDLKLLTFSISHQRRFENVSISMLSFAISIIIGFFCSDFTWNGIDKYQFFFFIIIPVVLFIGFIVCLCISRQYADEKKKLIPNISDESETAIPKTK
jgi:hypothetical protein